MATITLDQTGAVTVTLTPDEQRTVAALVDDSFAQYMTLWLAEKARHILSDKLQQLPAARRAAILSQIDERA